MNAANNIEATTKSLKNLLKDRRYKVGYFQREYKWQRVNVEDLIVDLERSFESNWNSSHEQTDVVLYDKYYMGPIVLHQEATAFSIVDGQQRLTSFTLLLIFLNKELEKLTKIKDKLKNYIFSEDWVKETYNLDIEERIEILDFLYRGTEIEDSIVKNESCNNLLERYNDIEELFPKTLLHELKLPLFVNWLTEKLVFVEIMTQTSESAYTIFETMNDRGLSLTPTEMLKSFLLSKSDDESKIKILDSLWKDKIGHLKTYSNESDLDFFRAWLRGKYAITIRTTETGASNQDFEQIGTKFHNWVQEAYKIKLKLNTKEDFYFFVASDFDFFSDVYLKLLSYEQNEDSVEHVLHLISYKGVSPSLLHPFILASIEKTDDELTVSKKINVASSFLDAFTVYRLLLNLPITHSSIRNVIYSKIKEIRNNFLETLTLRLQKELDDYKHTFLNDVDYISSNSSNDKYILARLYKSQNLNVDFENLYYQRRKESFIIYPFFSNQDIEVGLQMPFVLKEIFMKSLCSRCIVPKDIVADLDKMTVSTRINYLITHGYLIEYSKVIDFSSTSLKAFFVERNKKLKESISNIWKITEK